MRVEGADRLCNACKTTEEKLVLWTLPQQGRIAHLAGDGTAVPRSREAVVLAEELGSPFHSVLALQGFGAACLAAGRGDDAVDSLQDALSLARGRFVGLFEESSLLAYLADAHLLVDDPVTALRLAEEALAVSRAQHARVFECHALLSRARARRAIAHDDARAAISADLAEARSAVEESGFVAWSPFLAREQAWLAGEGP